MLSPQVPSLISYLSDHSLTEALLGALVGVSQASPSSFISFLPALRIVGQQSTALLGNVARIHGAVGIINEVKTWTLIHIFGFVFCFSADLQCFPSLMVVYVLC